MTQLDYNNTPIQSEVLGAIRSGAVKMRPKWHFVLRALLAAFGSIILLLTVVYLASFIVFVLRQSGAIFVPAFGLRGVYAFLVSVPWILIVFLFAFIVILELLVRRYAFTYRRPLLYSAVAVLGVMMVGGYTVAMSPLHAKMSTYAEQKQVPVAVDFYRVYGHSRVKQIHAGTIDEFAPSSFILVTRRGELLTVLVTQQTRFVPRRVQLSNGDTVVVLGPREVNVVEALGVHKVHGLK